MLISIYPRSKGEYREMQADANMQASGPFDSPELIAGRLVTLPSAKALREMRGNEVLYEGEVYRFKSLETDGAFELKKAW
ncbi:MAG TPA: hypothetical protein VHZ74_07435 [Bryobacteraceae bacterium]|jgi:hypothetical protein|nr:hypothetical protein [Bryobacteraceae bacterium]